MNKVIECDISRRLKAAHSLSIAINELQLNISNLEGLRTSGYAVNISINNPTTLNNPISFNASGSELDYFESRDFNEVLEVLNSVAQEKLQSLKAQYEEL